MVKMTSLPMQTCSLRMVALLIAMIATDVTPAVIRKEVVAVPKEDLTQSIKPSYGPVSGGTAVTVNIAYAAYNNRTLTVQLTSGNITVWCTVLSRSRSQLHFLTGRLNISTLTSLSPGGFNVSVVVKLNGSAIQNLSDWPVFTYKSDPIITHIQPMKTILAGGIHQTVIGQNLQSVASPSISVFVNDNITEPVLCMVYNDTLMKCQTPPLNINASSAMPEGQGTSGGHDDVLRTVDMRLNLDGINITDQEFRNLTVYRNPVIEQLPSDIPQEHTLNSELHLSLKGSWPKFNLSRDDVQLKIGKQLCDDLEIQTYLGQQNYVSCQPAFVSPNVVRFGSDLEQVPDVMIYVGYFHSSVGKLHYVLDEPFNVIMSVMIAILSFIFLISIIFGCLTICGVAIDCPSCAIGGAKSKFEEDDGLGKTVNVEGGNGASHGRRRRAGALEGEERVELQCVKAGADASVIEAGTARFGATAGTKVEIEKRPVL